MLDLQLFWTAFWLKKAHPDYKILIAEKHHYPLGASTRNAGFACFGSATEILADVEIMGWEKSLNLVQKRFEGLDLIKSTFADKIDFELCGGYELLNSNISFQQLQQINQKVKMQKT